MNYQGTLCPCGRIREHDYYRCNVCHAEYERNRRNGSAEAKEAARQACRDYRERLRDEMFAAYGEKCACPGGCNVVERDFLTLDHVGGGRKEHMKAAGVKAAGVFLYKDLRDKGWPKDGYRILCMNCNWAIRSGGKCPHEKRS